MSHENQVPVVLLVEDSDDDAFFFEHALVRSGVDCRLRHVMDGRAALRYLTAAREQLEPWPAAIFLDLKLPGFSGFDVLQWVREQTFDPPLKITVLSGSDHAADIAAVARLGFSDYVVKPISAELLRHRLQAPCPAGVPEPAPAQHCPS